MSKKIIISLLVLALLFSLASCATDHNDDGISEENVNTESTVDSEDNGGSGEQPDSVIEPTTILLNSATKGIKILGERNLLSDEQINLDWTCSGVEFILDVKEGEVVFAADSDAPCYFRAYVNGFALKNADGGYYFEVNGKTDIKLTSIPLGKQTVLLIKVTDNNIARASLSSVTVKGNIVEEAPADKGLYVEFVGADIVAGLGIISGTDAYKTEDGSQAYAYLTAKALDADYSITALSGQGLSYKDVSSFNLDESYLTSSPFRSIIGFHSFDRKADVTVIDLGVNDLANEVSADDFKAIYKRFIDTVIEYNGEGCKIVCVINGAYADVITEVCKEYGGQKSGFYTVELEAPKGDTPTADEQAEYAEQIARVVDNAYKGFLDGDSLTNSGAGDGMSVDINEFKPLR